MAESGRHPEWQTALLCIALSLVLVLGAWLYYVTSESYKIRRMQVKLGYKVPTIWSYFSWFFVCCTAPLVRQRWEKENQHFRTEDYAPLKRRRPALETFLDDGGEWSKLPRGDTKRFRSVVKGALAKLTATIVHDTIDEALKAALASYDSDAGKNARNKHASERLRAAAASWRTNTGLHRPHKKEEIDVMIRTFTAEDSSSDEESSDEGTDVWNLGCEMSFMKLAPREPKPITIRQRKSMIPESKIASTKKTDWGADPRAVRREGSRTKRLPSDPKGRPTVTPMTYGNWAGEPYSGKAAQLSGSDGTSGEQKDDRKHIVRVSGSRPVALRELKRISRGMTVESATPEFASIDLNIPRSDLLPPASHALTANVDIFPFKHAQVRMPQNQYINASYIRGPDGFPSKFVATQVPIVPGNGGFDKLPTVNLFWEMAFEQRASAIVLLDDDAAPFWPVEVYTPKLYGGVKVTSHGMAPSDHYTATTLQLERPRGGNGDSDKNSHTLILFEYRKWAEKIHDDIAAVLLLFGAVRAATVDTSDVPVIVMDADGGDRVGTFVVCEHCFEQIRKKESVDVLRAVADVREDRGGLISTPELYVAIYQIVTVFLLNAGLAIRSMAPPAYNSAPKY